jgi:DNA-binding CsgD family transcriptional regulator
MTSGIEVVGRDEELAVVAEFLDASEPAPAALLIEGEAGIGKTTVWQAGVEEARDTGHRTLVARPAQAESDLSFAGLADLLADLVDELPSALPVPQRRALEVALLLTDAEGLSADQRAIGAGFLNILRQLAAERPVTVAIDDVQWLDGPSALAVAFTARRLRDDPVRFLLSARADGEEPSQPELARAFASVRRMPLGPLSLGAIHRLLHQKLDVFFARPVLMRLHESAGGNPFFTLELGRALVRHGGAVEPGEELPVPASLRHLVAARLSALPPDSIAVLSAASVLAQPTIRELEAATGVDAQAALASAVRAQLVEVRGENVKFSHPLFAHGVHARLGARQLKELHSRLAGVVRDLEQRARHLALATDEPDATVAALLDRAAERAAARGAPAAAAELVELAIRFTPDEASSELNRRRLAAVDFYVLSGSNARVASLLDELATDAAPGPERARVLMRIADEIYDTTRPAVDIYRDALEEASGDRQLEAEIEILLGYRLAYSESLESGLAHVRRALELVGDSDRIEHAEALCGYAVLATSAGEMVPESLVERAVALDRQLGGPPRFRSPLKLAGCRELHLGRLEEAKRLLEEYETRAIEYGDEISRLNVLNWRVQVECEAGRLDRAESLAAEIEELTPGADRTEGFLTSALVLAYRGRADDAIGAACEARDRAARRRATYLTAMIDSIVGFVELSRGDAAAAWRILAPLPDRLDSIGHCGVGRMAPVHADAVEAAVAVGELEWAADLVERLRPRVRRVPGPAGLIAVGRGAGLVAAARGSFEEAFAAFEHALDAAARAPAPFEHARTLLALGAAQRRAKRRAEARQALQGALGAFEDFGARLWAARAREELDRIGGRRASGGELTAGERQLAELVAEGLSNKEIAAALFVTPKTVGTKLSRIYAKVGVHSRTELVRRLGERASKV